MNFYSKNDLSKLFGTATKFRVTGAIFMTASRDFVGKIANKINREMTNDKDFALANIARHYVEVGTEKELLNQKIADTEAKEQKLTEFKEAITQSDVDAQMKSYYQNKISDLIIKLQNQRANYNANGLNKFSLPKLVLMQFKKNTRKTMAELATTAQEKQQAVQENIQAKKETVQERIIQTTNKLKDNNVYTEIMRLLVKKLKAETELDTYRRDYPDIYEKVISDATGEEKKDDDFIEEVELPRRSSR